MSITRLDLAGLKCPLPVLKTRKALAALQKGAQLHVVCTDPMAAIDIPNMLRETGDHLADQKREDKCLIFEIEKR